MWQRIREMLWLHEKQGHSSARIRAVIVKQQQQSELLIGWAQLLIGLIWTALYFASPKTFSADVPFEPVPVALGIYVAFTVLRLALSWQRIAPRWFLALSVMLDMCILMALIWSFHLQYEQPAAFYLKAPTVLYVFLFIALRTLRFSVGYLLLSGMMAGLAWAAMVYYAYVTAPEGMGVTRDYVLYMTSSHILVGAELDKIITILLTTGILAVAIVRARRLLVAAVVEETARDDLARFFSPQIAAAITEAGEQLGPGEAVARRAAIMVVDIRGFTQLSKQLSPNQTMALLADYQNRIVPVIQAEGGVIDKFMGDGILASFGAVLPNEHYAADAMRAVYAVLQAAQDWRRAQQQSGAPILEVGVAVVAGPVLSGVVGAAERLEYTVVGEPVNLAAKLENANKAQNSRALTDSATLALAKAQGFQPRQEIAERRDCAVAGLKDRLDLQILADRVAA